MLDFENLEDKIIETYNQYYLDVYRFLICFTGNQNDAEDLTQEVFIRVLNNFSDARHGNLKTWIFLLQSMLLLTITERRDSVQYLPKVFLNKLHQQKKNQMN